MEDDKTMRTGIIATAVAFCILASGASYCGKTSSDNYRAIATNCIEAGGYLVPGGAVAICIRR